MIKNIFSRQKLGEIENQEDIDIKEALKIKKNDFSSENENENLNNLEKKILEKINN